MYPMKRIACLLCAFGLTLWSARPSLAMTDPTLVTVGNVTLSEGDTTDYTGVDTTTTDDGTDAGAQSADSGSADDSTTDDSSGDDSSVDDGSGTDDGTSVDDGSGADDGTTTDDGSGTDDGTTADDGTTDVGGPILDENGNPVIYYAFQEKGARSADTVTHYRGTVSTSGPKLRPSNAKVTVAVTNSATGLTKLVLTNHSPKGNAVVTYKFNGNGHFTGTVVSKSSTVTLSGTYKATARPGGGISMSLSANESNNLKGRLTLRITPHVLSAGAVETRNGVTVDRQYIRATVVSGGRR